MKYVLAALACCLVLPAASGAEHDLLFVRGGRVYYWQQGASSSFQAIANDPGWTYTLPTWVDYETIAVLRYKLGKSPTSQLGLITAVDRLPVKPSQITWLPWANGAWSIGACPEHSLLGYTKIVRRKGSDTATLTLTVGPLNSEFGDPQQVGECYDPPSGYGDTRLRFNEEGTRVVVPAFPTDVSSTVDLFDLERGQVVDVPWLDFDWLAARQAGPEIGCAAFFLRDTIALGAMLRGLYLYSTAAQRIRPLDTWETGQAGVREVSLSAGQETIYYEVLDYRNAKATPEVRAYHLPSGRKSVVLRNASQPDARPAAG
ncbi:MAG: hypothetical protein IT204_24095 [Fimbriimonadaceae bacterium]|nr:hypothetical protein [Fimbriimonadaceae bacterium]